MHQYAYTFLCGICISCCMVLVLWNLLFRVYLPGILDKDYFGSKIMEFWSFFYPLAVSMRMALTVRDLLSWVGFMNALSPLIGPRSAFVHGCFLVLLDGLGLGSGSTQEIVQVLRHRCCEFLTNQFRDINDLVQEASGFSCNKEGVIALCSIFHHYWLVCPSDYYCCNKGKSVHMI